MADVLYRFVASGEESVHRAFEGIERAAIRQSRTVARSQDAQTAATRRGAAERERAERRPVSRTEQLAKQVERDQNRAAQREVRSREQALAYVARIRDRHFADQQRKEAQHTDRVIRMAAQSERAKIRQAEESGRRRAAIERQYQDRVIRERQGRLGRIGGELKGAALGAAVGVGVAGAALGGAATRDAMSVQSLANRISINARKSGQGFISPTVLRREFEATALASNGTLTAEQVGQGQQAFITKTGRLDLARRFSGTFAKTAAATGTDYSKIASAGAELSQKFKIETEAAMGEALAAITFGGKEGAFELSDAADKYAKLASAGATFGLDKGVAGVRTLQGLSQIPMASTGDRDVATTAVESMFRQIVTNSTALDRKYGVDVFTDESRTKARRIEDLLPEIMGATGGDKVALQKIFGDEGKRAINPLIDTFTEAYQGATGKGGKAATEKERSAAGVAAVKDALSAAINAPGTFKDIERDAAQAQQDPAAKMALQYERLKAAAADKLLPALERLVDKLEASPEVIDAFVGTLEVLLEALETAGKAFGIIKDKSGDPEHQKREERKRIKAAEEQIALLPSAEKAAALRAQGRTAEADAMEAEMAAPGFMRKRLMPAAEKLAAQERLGKIDALERDIMAARTPQQFADLYTRLAADPTSDVQRNVAEKAAADIARQGTESRYASDTAIVGAKETPEQKRARLGFVQNTAEDRIRAGGTGGGEASTVAATGVAAAFAKVIAAAEEASGAMKKISEANSASVVTG